MSLSAKDVDAIMRMLEASHFDRLALEVDGLKLELERGGTKPKSKSKRAPDPVPTPPPAPPAPVATASREGLVEVKSPLLGIYYRAPKPGEPPFVEVGSKVEKESIIGIIEVMKLMNSARAGVKGEVVEIVGRNGELVEHGEVLMFVRPEA